MAEVQKAELGDEVRSEITGIQGIMVGRTVCLHGCDRISVQPQDPEGKKVLDGFEVDDVRIQVVTRGKVKPILENLPRVEFELGDEVYDEIENFKGHVTSLTTSINGCIYASVKGKRGKDEVVASAFQHVNRFKKTGKPKPESASRPSKSGGFDTRMERPE